MAAHVSGPVVCSINRTGNGGGGPKEAGNTYVDRWRNKSKLARTMARAMHGPRQMCISAALRGVLSLQSQYTRSQRRKSIFQLKAKQANVVEHTHNKQHNHNTRLRRIIRAHIWPSQPNEFLIDISHIIYPFPIIAIINTLSQRSDRFRFTWEMRASKCWQQNGNAYVGRLSLKMVIII